MTTNAILFDLDDTLLGNNIDHFIPRYFALLGEYARPLFADSGQFFQELLVGTRAMVANTDRSLTNRDVFWQVFQERTGLDVAETEAFFNRFYEDPYRQLEAATQPRPVAAKLVKRAVAEGYRVAVATNPLFPRRAIEQRLAWAGLPVEEHEFALVTAYDNMHATKPHVAYYEEILEKIGAEPASTLMVGDDWANDIQPAAALGMQAYWITPTAATPPDPALICGRGTLDDFYHWLFDEAA